MGGKTRLSNRLGIRNDLASVRMSLSDHAIVKDKFLKFDKRPSWSAGWSEMCSRTRTHYKEGRKGMIDWVIAG